MTNERISDERLEWFLGPGCFATWLERTELVRGYRAHQSQAAEIAALRAFAQQIMQAFPEGGIDGDELQGIAVDHGMLIAESRAEPCGDECFCAGYVRKDEWPVECYRRTPLLTGNPAPAGHLPPDGETA